MIYYNIVICNYNLQLNFSDKGLACVSNFYTVEQFLDEHI